MSFQLPDPLVTHSPDPVDPEDHADEMYGPPLIDCPPRCGGDGEIRFNPSRSVPKDPQLEDTARCPDCHGEGTVRPDDFDNDQEALAA